ncbi:MAG TPA: class I SAM-dependent methyltransferase [Thermomicrobiaceae bacterium]|nr:class I SAM-dependent methyltransferase [Thermomicrobiaceae bacterium]
MVVERSARRCLLCDRSFTGRTFLCRPCADRYRAKEVPIEIRRRFYEEIDRRYPSWSNTGGDYNPPAALLGTLAGYPRQSNVLEIGAGGGFNLLALEQLGFTRLFGLDLTQTSLPVAARRSPTAHLLAADAATLPFTDGSFDLLFSCDLIEHLPELEQHLAEARRVLRPGGAYLIKTPNRSAAEIYYRLAGLYDAYFWHPSMVSEDELRTVLRRHSFGSVFLSPEALTPAQLRKVPAPLRRFAKRLPLRQLPPQLRPHFEVVAPVIA